MTTTCQAPVMTSGSMTVNSAGDWDPASSGIFTTGGILPQQNPQDWQQGQPWVQQQPWVMPIPGIAPEVAPPADEIVISDGSGNLRTWPDSLPNTGTEVTIQGEPGTFIIFDEPELDPLPEGPHLDKCPDIHDWLNG